VAANDAIGHHHRLGSGRLDERQYFLRNTGITANVGSPGEPTSKFGSLGILGRHNADSKLGGHGIVGAIERDGCDRPAAKASLGPLAQPLASPLKHLFVPFSLNWVPRSLARRSNVPQGAFREKSRGAKPTPDRRAGPLRRVAVLLNLANNKRRTVDQCQEIAAGGFCGCLMQGLWRACTAGRLGAGRAGEMDGPEEARSSEGGAGL
jgi:hypothetical protein